MAIVLKLLSAKPLQLKKTAVFGGLHKLPIVVERLCKPHQNHGRPVKHKKKPIKPKLS